MKSYARVLQSGLTLALLTLALPSFAGRGVSDTGNENCTYAGLKLDRGAQPGTKGKVSSVADDFSGLVVCTDPESKRVYETYELTQGKRHGETRLYDRRSGRLVEQVPYTAGVRDGCVKRYDDRSGHLTSQFCVRNNVPQGVDMSFDAQTGVMTRIKWVSAPGQPRDASEIQFNKKGQLTFLDCGPQTLMGVDDLWCGRGNREGQATLYSSEGWPWQVVTYRNGKRQGWTRTYGEDGKLRSEERFEDGKSVERRKFDTSGQGKRYERVTLGDVSKEIIYFDESKTPRLALERTKGRITKELAYFANGKPHYQKSAKGEGYDLKHYDDNGSLVAEGFFVPLWAHEVGLWGLVPQGSVKRYKRGVLVEEANYANNSRRDGLQKYFDSEQAGRLRRREHYKQGTLLWSEDVFDNRTEALRREYAEDGSIARETIVSVPKTL